MKKSLILASIVAIVPATPLSSVHRLESRQAAAFCPNITITALGIVGSQCAGNNYYAHTDEFATSGTLLFDQFQVQANPSSDGSFSDQSGTCTGYLNLGYPLPVPQGCPTTGYFYARKAGRNNLQNQDQSTRTENIDFVNGPNVDYFQGSTSQDFRESTITDLAPQTSYIDEVQSTFVFAADPNGSPGGSTVQDLVTMSVFFEIDLYSASQAQITLDSFDLYVRTDGYSLGSPVQ